MPGDTHGDVSTLRNHLAVVWRRKWLILQALVVIPVMAVFLSLRQEPMYEAAAEVIFSQQDFAASLTNLYTPWEDPSRTVETQARLATSPFILRRVMKKTGTAGMTAEQFAKRTKVVTKQNANVLEFRVTFADRAKAARLANEYAQQFIAYRAELDTEPIVRARNEVAGRLRELRAEGSDESALYASLVEKDEQLGTIQTLQTSRAFLVRPAEDAVQVQPRPLRVAIVATVLALVIAAALALIFEALDTRVRSVEGVANILGLPLLGNLPNLPRRLRKDSKLATIAEPSGPHAEAFRMLRTNFDLVNLDRKARVVMITSATPEEGKSTTAANLAITLARGGRRVIIVDLDLRRPSIARSFGCEGRPGVTDVVLGNVELDDALTSVVVLPPSDADVTKNGNGSGKFEMVVEVLASGLLPPDPGEFVLSPSLMQLLYELRQRADVILIDSPPLLHVGDAMALAINVDALMIVVRIDTAKKGPLRAVRRAIEASPTKTLGFIANGVGENHGYYAYGQYYHPKRDPQRVGSPS